MMLASILVPAACVGGEEFTATPADDIGGPCSWHSDCAYACMDGISGMGNYCTRACADSTGCPAGYVCVSRAGLGRACTIGDCSNGEVCPDGYHCAVADPNEPDYRVCEHDELACSADTDCPGAIACNQSRCATVCGGDEDCKQGFVCQWDRGCVECQRPADCPNGFACVAGQCSTACVDWNDCRQGHECTAAACTVIVGGGAGTLGTGCSEDAECVDFCSQGGVCSQLCTGVDDTSCGTGFRCNEHHLICEPG
jgi:hypothetical protein